MPLNMIINSFIALKSPKIIAMSLSEKLALNKLMTDFVFNKSEEVIARFEENNYVTIHRDQG